MKIETGSVGTWALCYLTKLGNRRCNHNLFNSFALSEGLIRDRVRDDRLRKTEASYGKCVTDKVMQQY